VDDLLQDVLVGVVGTGRVGPRWAAAQERSGKCVTCLCGRGQDWKCGVVEAAGVLRCGSWTAGGG
jgi:hypothetical protein